MCAAYQYGKSICWYTNTITTTTDPSKWMELNEDNLKPVKHVSVDHFKWQLTGRIYTYRVNTDIKDMYHGG